MTDLTEQWKRGEFIICNAGKCQYYYVRNEEQQEVIKTEYCLFDDNTPNWQILAPVPSYDEWQALKASYEMLNDANLKQATWMVDMEKENSQLKELLKECSIANTALVGIMDWFRKSTIPEQRENCEYLFEKTQELQKQLDEALK